MKTICALVLLCCCCHPVKAAWILTNLTSTWIQIGPNDVAGPNLLTNNAFTLSAWIVRKVDRGATRAVIISKGQTQPNPLADSICYHLDIITNRFRFYYSPPGGGVVHTWVATTAAPNTNVLAHVALKYVYGSPTSIVMFVNGTNYTGAWVDGDGTAPGTNHTKSTMFGQDGFGTPLMGWMNDFAIWNTNISDREILSLHTSRLKGHPLTVARDYLVGYWPMDGWPELKAPTTDIIPLVHNLRYYPDHYGKHSGSIDGFGDFVALNERMFSYPPNE